MGTFSKTWLKIFSPNISLKNMVKRQTVYSMHHTIRCYHRVRKKMPKSHINNADSQSSFMPKKHH